MRKVLAAIMLSVYVYSDIGLKILKLSKTGRNLSDLTSGSQ